MASANSNIQISDLDFGAIKSSLKNYLQNQSTFSDYNFEGSALSTLLDILAYNTHYNSYYLNMAANEMFLDTASMRSSVISHAKLLNYTPKSTTAAKAFIDFSAQCEPQYESIIIPKNTKLISEQIDGKSYIFSTSEQVVSPTYNSGGSTFVDFYDIEITQGKPITYQYSVDKALNPTLTFKIPDSNIDTSTLSVYVKTSSSSTSIEVYTLAKEFTKLDNTSSVYFLQESLDGYYEIYFGDGILGKSLDTGNIVNISYIISDGKAVNGANSFTFIDSVSGVSTYNILPKRAARGGSPKESIESIKYTAPKAYSAQNRAVTKEDYIYLIQNNSGVLPIDSVNVWGGEEETPPVYGKIFVAVKPSGGYSLTLSQKRKIINDIISPISILTVTPEIVDPDYTYIKIQNKVWYSNKKTTLSENQLSTMINSNVFNYIDKNVNKFNSIFNLPDMITAINAVDSSIVTNESNIYLQKKFYPILQSARNYVFNYGVPIKKDLINKSVSISPAFQQKLSTGSFVEMMIEEVPTDVTTISSIKITNPGYGYDQIPTVTIYGDGTGAKAYAEVINGKLSQIVLTNPGTGYTQALVELTNGGNGLAGKAEAILNFNIGKLRSYYISNSGIKIINNSDVGSVDYDKGIINLTEFSPYSFANNALGELTITISPSTSYITSDRNRIITIDPMDPYSVTTQLVSIK